MIKANNFFTLMPNALVTYIASFCDPNTQTRLITTNSKIRPLVHLARQSLCVTLPRRVHSCWDHTEDTNMLPQTLVNFLIRFPNITSLILRNPFNEYCADIAPLTSFLSTNYPKHLNHLRLREPNFDGHHLLEARRLTKIFFNAFGHSQILSLAIDSDSDPRSIIINSKIINSTLKKCRNLTSFKFDGDGSNIRLKILLWQCPKLQRLILINVKRINNTTIRQLRLCRNLTELRVDLDSSNPRKPRILEEFLCSNHELNLRILSLKFSKCLSTDETLDLATQRLANLEALSLDTISNEGLVRLANNCRKLTTLKSNFIYITDAGIADFALSAPQLRKLDARDMLNITHHGLCILAQHCKKLEALTLSLFRDLTPEVLSALAENCKNLQFLEIIQCLFKDVDLQRLEDFITSFKSLRYFYIDDMGCEGISAKTIAALYKKFSHLRRPGFDTFDSL